MLSWAERLMIFNQYEILKHVNPSERKSYQEYQEIVASGYEIFYEELYPIIPRETLNTADAKEVMEILDLFRAISNACEKREYEPKSPWAKFRGFDGNIEGRQYGFAMFLRRTQGKWRELEKFPDNSHHHGTLHKYRNMIAAWHGLGEKRELTAAEIEEIAEA